MPYLTLHRVNWRSWLKRLRLSVDVLQVAARVTRLTCATESWRKVNESVLKPHLTTPAKKSKEKSHGNEWLWSGPKMSQTGFHQRVCERCGKGNGNKRLMMKFILLMQTSLLWWSFCSFITLGVYGVGAHYLATADWTLSGVNFLTY